MCFEFLTLDFILPLMLWGIAVFVGFVYELFLSRLVEMGIQGGLVSTLWRSSVCGGSVCFVGIIAGFCDGG